MYIAIAGNIGSGKTTLAEKLGKNYRWDVEYEAVDTNPYLPDFYADMKSWAFHIQVYFLNSRFRQNQIIKKMNGNIIQDRTIYEDAHVLLKISMTMVTSTTEIIAPISDCLNPWLNLSNPRISSYT